MTSSGAAHAGSAAASERVLRSDARRNHERLLGAAREVLAEEGPTGSLEEVARRARVGIATLYRHFPTRDALLEELIDSALARVLGFAEEALATDDAWCGLESFVLRTLEQHQHVGALGEVFGRQRYADRVDRFRARLGRLVDQLVRRAREDGAVRADLGGGDVTALVFAGVRLSAAGGQMRSRRHVALALDGMRAVSCAPLPGRTPAAYTRSSAGKGPA